MAHGGERTGAGRPKSEATLRTQLAREYISLQVKDSLGAIVAKAISQAVEGNHEARQWLSDRAWGKPHQALAFTDSDGEPIEVIVGMRIINDNGTDVQNKEPKTA